MLPRTAHAETVALRDGETAGALAMGECRRKVAIHGMGPAVSGDLRDWATCEFLTTLGNPSWHPEIEPLIKQHDDATRAESGLPLA